MADRLPLVFTSATTADLASYRQSVRDQLLSCRVFPVSQEHFIPDCRTVGMMLEDAVSQCDAVVCLVGTVFGASPPSCANRSYTQMEYDTARRLGKPTFVFFADPNCCFDKPVLEDAERQRLQADYIETVRRNEAAYWGFSSHEELRRKVAELAPTISASAQQSPAPTSSTSLLSNAMSFPELSLDTGLQSTIERLLQLAVAPLLSWLARPPVMPADAAPREVTNIPRSYWGQTDFQPGRLVTIRGSLSPFAPLLVGPPYVKRDLHRDFRARLPEYVETATTSAIDARMGFTAGQMVWRLNLEWLGWRYMGLYEGIVRNAVPVFVSEETYATSIAPALEQLHAGALDVEVTGRLGAILPYSTGLRGIGVDPEYVDRMDLSDAFAVFVDSTADERSSIRVLGQSGYIDGDIWTAVGTESEEEVLLMPGVNLADSLDVRTQRRALVQRSVDSGLSSSVLFHFDQEAYPSQFGEQAVDARAAALGLGLLAEEP